MAFSSGKIPGSDGTVVSNQSQEITQQAAGGFALTPEQEKLARQEIDQLKQDEFYSSLHLDFPFQLSPDQESKLKNLAKQAKKYAAQKTTDPLQKQKITAERLAQFMYTVGGLNMHHRYSAQARTAGESLNLHEGECREMAYLYTFMAREAGLDAIFLGVVKYADQQTVYQKGEGHLITGIILANGEVLQVDPTEGDLSSHQQVEYLSDASVAAQYIEAESHSLKSGADEARKQMGEVATKIGPEETESRLRLLAEMPEDQKIEGLKGLERDFDQDSNVLNGLSGAYLRLAGESSRNNGLQNQYLQKALNLAERAIKLEKPGIYTPGYLNKANVLFEMGKFDLWTENPSEEFIATNASLRKKRTEEAFQTLLDGLDHEPYNPLDRKNMKDLLHNLDAFGGDCEKNKQGFVEDGLNIHGKKITWQELGDKRDQLNQKLEVPFTKYPDEIRWLIKRGHFEDASMMCTEAENKMEKMGPEVLSLENIPVIQEIQYLRGELKFIQGEHQMAGLIWERAKDTNLSLFSSRLEQSDDPWDARSNEGKEWAERVLLLDSHNAPALRYLTLWHNAHEGQDKALELTHSLPPDEQELYQNLITVYQNGCGDSRKVQSLLDAWEQPTIAFLKKNAQAYTCLWSVLLRDGKQAELNRVFSSTVYHFEDPDGTTFDPLKTFKNNYLALKFILKFARKMDPEKVEVKTQIKLAKSGLNNLAAGYYMDVDGAFLQDSFESDASLLFELENSSLKKGSLPELKYKIETEVHLQKYYSDDRNKHLKLDPQIKLKRLEELKKHPAWEKLSKDEKSRLQ